MNAIDARRGVARSAGARRRRSRGASPRCAPAPRRWRRRSRRKTRPSSRCPTPARPSGTARTPRGSSRPSCCCRTFRAIARFREEFGFLFNSYYEAAGPRHARPKRGMLTRPSSDEVGAYRAHVDAAMAALMRDPPPGRPRRPDRARPAARGAAPGAARHRRPARAGAESPLPGLRSGMAGAGHDAGPARFLARPDGRGGDRPGSRTAGRASPSTTRPRGTASSLRPSASPTGW